MSRRKQQNPKSISKGPVLQSPLSRTGCEETEVITQDEDEEYDLLGTLIVDENENSDSETIETEQPHINKTFTKADPAELLYQREGSYQQNRVSPADSTPTNDRGDFDDSLKNSIPNGTHSYHNNSVSVGNITEAIGPSELVAMTRGVEDTGVLSGSDASQPGNAQTNLSRPRQHTPSKTRRKSDKIVPIMDDRGSKKYICPVCQQDMFTEGELTKHIRSHNASAALNTCKICSKVLSSQSSLDRHMLVHSGERPFKCKICGMSFTTNGNMHRHSRIHDKEPGLSGPNSPVSKPVKPLQVAPSHKAPMYRHYPSLVPSGQFSKKRKSSEDGDSDCGAETTPQHNKRFFLGVEDLTMMARDKVELGSPDKLTNTKEPAVEESGCTSDVLQCPICLKPFLCRYGLETHWDTCHPDEPSLCQLCHTAFPTTRQVYVHYMLTHTNSSTTLQPEWEHYAELQQQLQKDANNAATGFHELGFTTDFSSASFAQIAKVWCEKNQRQASSSGHNFNCRKCGHAFPCAEALISHLKNHPADATAVTCKSCDLSFRTRQAYEDHMTQHSTKDVVKGYSGKIGTDDNDIQDMVSQPEFMLVLGLKSSNSEAGADKSDRLSEKIREDLRKAIAEKKVPIGTKVKTEQGMEVKPMVIQPITEHEVTSVALQAKSPYPKPSASPRLLVSPHPAFPPPRIFPPLLIPGAQTVGGSTSRSTSPGSDISSRATMTTPSEGEGHPESGGEEGGCSEIEVDSRRPYQCVICEYAFCTKNQCETHCRSKHGLSTTEELSGAISLNQQPNRVSRGNQPSWFYRPLVCSLCKNGFSTKENCLKHLIKQHRVHEAVSERYLVYSSKRRADKPSQPTMHQSRPQTNHSGGGGQGLLMVGSDKKASTVLSGSSSTHRTYITTPPILRPQITPEHSETEEDQPLDFSMKRKPSNPVITQNTKNAAKHFKFSGRGELKAPGSRNDQPIDLTLKLVKEEPVAPSVIPWNVVSMGFSSHSGYQASLPSPSRLSEMNPSMSSGHVTSSSSPQVNIYSSKSHPFLCHQCPASFTHQMALERHRVSKHPQSEINKRKHVPLPVPSQPSSRSSKSTSSLRIPPPSLSPSATSKPQTQPPPEGAKALTAPGSSSDSELSSVSRMMDATSSLRIQQFLSLGPLESSAELDREIPELSIDLTERDTDKDMPSGRSPSLLDESLNGDGDQPTKRKRNSYSDSPHKLQCPYCPRAFPWISSLNRHILTHTGQKPYKCPECTVTFSTKSNRERHMVRKHGLDIHDPATRAAMERPYTCHKCEGQYTCATEIEKHFRDCHPATEVPDYIVDQARCERQPAVNPSDRQDADMLSTGDFSEGPNSSIMDFEDEDMEDECSIHSLESSPTKKLAPSTTPSPVSHLPTLTPKPSVTNTATPDTSVEVPEYLGKINPERDNYNVDRITQCWKCHERFDSRKMLLRHLKEHNIDSSFKCYLCDASYETREASLQHTVEKHPHDWVLLQEKNKCYSLAEYSANMDRLVVETLENLGLAGEGGEGGEGGSRGEEGEDKPDSDYAQRKVFCSFCVKRFWSLQDLRRHMRSHTGERPFECDICQKRFTLKHSMMRHRRKHTAAELATLQNGGQLTTPPQSESEEESVVEGGSSLLPVQSGLKVAMFSHRPQNVTRNVNTPTEEEGEASSKNPEEASNNDDDILSNLLGIDSELIDNRINQVLTADR